MCIPLLLREKFCMCILVQFHLLGCLTQLFLYCLSAWMFYPVLKWEYWSILILLYFALFFPVVLFFYLFMSFAVGCICIYNCYVHLMNWSFHHYIMFFFVSFNNFDIKTLLSSIKYSHSSSLLFIISIGDILCLHFQTFHFLKSEVGFPIESI